METKGEEKEAEEVEEEEEEGKEVEEVEEEGEDIMSQLFNFDLYEALQIVFLRFPSTADSSH